MLVTISSATALVDDDRCHTLRVLPREDSSPVAFVVCADRPGQHEPVLRAFVADGGRHLGTLLLRFWAVPRVTRDGADRAARCKDIEIAVLRHQLMVVVRRQAARPRYTAGSAGVGDVGASGLVPHRPGGGVTGLGAA